MKRCSMEKVFTNKDTWHGGFYELSLEMGQLSDIKLEAAVNAIWNFADLRGCYLRPDIDPPFQSQVQPDVKVLLSHNHLRGIAKLPDGKQVACGTYLVQEEQGDKWLGFYVPMGALAMTFDQVGAYPFDSNGLSRNWREPLESWLATIGQSVFSKVPFLLGLVGFEVSGTVRSSELKISRIPDERFIGYLYPIEGKLTWFPTNQWQHLPQAAS
jgi:hypothetical protein